MHIHMHIHMQALQQHGQLFVDTKFEFGYVRDASGKRKLIYMDEVGTTDKALYLLPTLCSVGLLCAT